MIKTEPISRNAINVIALLTFLIIIVKDVCCPVYNWVDRNSSLFRDGGYVVLPTSYQWTIEKNDTTPSGVMKIASSPKEEPPPLIVIVKGDKNIGAVKLNLGVTGASKGYLNKSKDELSQLKNQIHVSSENELIIEGMDFKNSPHKEKEMVFVIDKYNKMNNLENFYVHADNIPLKKLNTFTSQELFTEISIWIIATILLITVVLLLFDHRNRILPPLPFGIVQRPKTERLPRISLADSVRFNYDGALLDGTCEDISVAGAHIASETLIAPNQNLRLHFEDKKTKKEIIVEAVVKRQTTEGMGVRFKNEPA